MMYAYDEMYLKKAQYSLGSMLDFAVYSAGQSLSVFYGLFVNSRIAKDFAHGSPKYVAGRSGIELATLCDIPLKTIQNFEQRRKDINKASVDYVIRLSRALHCTVEDLTE